LAATEKRSRKPLIIGCHRKKEPKTIDYWLPQKKRSRKPLIIGCHRKKEPKTIDYWLPQKKGAENH